MSRRSTYGGVARVAVLTAALALMAGQGLGVQSAGMQTEQAAASPMAQEFKGVRLGMSQDEVRKVLGKPAESDDTQDYYELSNTRRIRVYYGSSHRANALVATFIGKSSGAPAPEVVLGTAVKAGDDGAASGSVLRAEEGYRLSYSRTGGDTPMVFITLQKL